MKELEFPEETGYTSGILPFLHRGSTLAPCGQAHAPVGMGSGISAYGPGSSRPHPGASAKARPYNSGTRGQVLRQGQASTFPFPAQKNPVSLSLMGLQGPEMA